MAIYTSGDNGATSKYYSATLDEEFTLVLAKGDGPRSGLDSLLFATTTGNIVLRVMS